jgi:GDP-4-dehydro-6-deoxy-D-mannose reductase
MRVLVTGATGFVGRHLIRVLAQAGDEPIAAGGPGDLACDLTLDLRDAASVAAAVRTARPEAVVHLAGMAFVPAATRDPLLAYDVNGLGTVRVLEAVRALGTPIRVLVISSAEVYGLQRPERMPLDETTPLRPANPYAASKVAAEAAAQAWVASYGLDVMIARPFNHIGPGQAVDFVVPSFASRLAAIAAGAPSVLEVGNLEAERDFLDVRDVVEAYRALLVHGRAGEMYNISGGSAVAIREVLRQLITLARVPVEVRNDPARMRPSDLPRLIGDASRLRAATGWAPRISLATSLADVYAEARERVAQA